MIVMPKLRYIAWIVNNRQLCGELRFFRHPVYKDQKGMLLPPLFPPSTVHKLLRLVELRELSSDGYEDGGLGLLFSKRHIG